MDVVVAKHLMETVGSEVVVDALELAGLTLKPEVTEMGVVTFSTGEDDDDTFVGALLEESGGQSSGDIPRIEVDEPVEERLERLVLSEGDNWRGLGMGV